MKRYKRLIILFLIAAVVVANSTEPPRLARSQAGEPRFSFPGAGRFELTSYFDHHAPDYSIDNTLTIYTTEVG